MRLSAGDIDEVIALGLSRAALDLPNPREPVYGIDPYARAPRWKLAAYSVSRIMMTTFLTNAWKRRIMVAAGLLVIGLAVAAGWLWTPASAREAARLVERVGIQPGMTVGEIGAGSGTMAIAVARHVGPAGHVYANELATNRLVEIEQKVTAEHIRHVTVVEGAVDGTNLPQGCCDAVFMRHVYHHFTEDAVEPMLASLRASIKPGGTLAIIDFPSSRLLDVIIGRPDGTGDGRSGHGIARDTLVDEVTGAGFTYVETVHRWSGRSYLAVFRAPEA